MIKRTLLPQIQKQLRLGKSILLLGPRQVGKTTLSSEFDFDLKINFAKASARLEFEKHPQQLEALIHTLTRTKKQKKIPLIYIDEVQLVPQMMSEIQVLVDEKKAQFFLTGSSARKLREQSSVNLIPGRVVNFRLEAFSQIEYEQNLDDLMCFGQLPEIALTQDHQQKTLLLNSYVENYIEEEIRKESKVRNIANYARFIELAAIQSGEVCNFTEISKDLGPTVMTIQSYFQILEDTLLVDRIDPYLKNASRKKLTKSSRYLFYDLGVRRVAAKEGTPMLPDRKGRIFEQLVGLEILKWIRCEAIGAQLYFWRDSDGPEVDWIVEYEGLLLPIEVKLSKKINNSDVKHLKTFMTEYKNAKKSIVVNSSDLFHEIEKNIEEVGFQYLHQALSQHFGV